MTIGGSIGQALDPTSDDNIWSGADDAVSGVFDVGQFAGDVIGGFSDLEDFVRNPMKWLAEQFQPDLPETPEGVLLTKQGNVQPLPVCYGERRLGGVRIFVDTTGTKNEYLHMVLALCEGEINAINSVWINDEEVANGDIDGNGDVISGKFSGLLRIKKYLGTDSQTADADLVADSSNWTTDHRLRGVAYVYIRAKWDQENRAFGSFPRVQADVQGRKLYDPRTSTTAYSSNPALVLYDYLTNSRYGRGLAASDLDVPSFEDAADYSDAQVTPFSGAGYTINRYACDGVINTGRKLFDNIKDLLTSCRGFLPYTAGKWTLILDKAESTTGAFTFDASNTLGAISVKGGGRRQRLNRISVTYANPDEDWQPDITVRDSATFRTADNGLLLETKVTLNYTANVYRAIALGEMELRQSRQGITARLRSTMAAQEVMPGHVVKVTNDTLGWTDKPFRVAKVDMLSDHTLGFSLTEYESTVYDLTLPTEVATPADTNLPDPTSTGAPTGLTLSSGTSDLVKMSDGTILTRVKATWTPPNDIYVEEYDVEYAVNGGNWLPAANPKGQAADTAYITSVDDGDVVDVRVRAVNSYSVPSTWAESLGHTVVGKTEPPSDVTGFGLVVEGSQVRMGWNAVGDVDVAGYEIRKGGSWDTASFVAKVDGTTYLANGLAEGAHEFLVKAVDTSGNESTNSTSDSITVAAPNTPTLANAINGENLVLSWTATAGDFPIDHYEIRYGSSWAAGTFVAEQKATTFTTRVDWANTRTWWVAAIDTASNVSTPANAGVTIAVAGAPTLSKKIIDNNVLLRWTPSAGTLPIHHHEIRKGSVFASAEVLGEATGTFTTHFENSSGTYTYWVVAVDSAGNYGTEASIVAEVAEPPDFTLNTDWESDFSGTKTNAFVKEDGHLLVPVNTSETWTQHFTNNSWSTPQDQIDAGYDYYAEPSQSTASYVEEFDYGTVLASSMITVTPQLVTVAGSVGMQVTISVRKLVTDSWTDYTNTTQVFAYDFRYVKITVDFTSSGGNDLAELQQLSVRLHTKRKTDEGMGTANSGDSGGTTVNFNISFVDVQSIVVSPKGTSDVKAVYDFTDTPNPTSFSVYLFDNTGSRVSGDFSWAARGV